MSTELLVLFIPILPKKPVMFSNVPFSLLVEKWYEVLHLCMGPATSPILCCAPRSQHYRVLFEKLSSPKYSRIQYN